MEGKPDQWLVYSKDADWLVTNTEGKEANVGFGFCRSDENGYGHPTSVKAWDVALEGTKWQPQPGVSATAMVCPNSNHLPLPPSPNALMNNCMCRAKKKATYIS